MPPVSMARAARRPLNTVCSSEQSSRLSVTTVFSKKGVTGENLLRICESRLDNVVYLLGWANSRAEARQLVVHGHYKVNGKKVDVPSYLLKAGDVVSIKEKSRESDKIKAVLETNSARPVPAWLEADADKLTAKVIALPERDQIMVPVEEHLIVELYSK